MGATVRIVEPRAVRDAYATCTRLAAAHYENFPVASHLLPRHMRPHVAAVYAFARAADDFADEGSWSEVERHRLIDDWRDRLRRCADGSSAGTHVEGADGDERDQVFLALGDPIRSRQFPVLLFWGLLGVFRQGVTTH